MQHFHNCIFSPPAISLKLDIQLLISFMPIGTKLTIYNNILYPQAPRWHQSVMRFYNNDNKQDLYFLFHVLIRFTKFYNFMKESEDAQIRALYGSLIELSKLGIDNLYDPQNMEVLHHVSQSLKAHHIFKRDRDYVVRENKVVIVDEFTGRVMPGRRWSDGQHQAIEAKEELQIQPETQTLASITYQNFFLLYPRLAGMTGTAKTEETEFEKTYKLETTIVPTNRVRARQDWVDQVYKTEEAKWRAVALETAEVHQQGRPVLVGTTSVEKSELLSSLLAEQNIPHNLLNAKPENVEREAEIVAQAGRSGAVTIATNMAGRGTDIILGGNSDYMARLKLREVLLPRLVRPEEGHRPPVPLQRSTDGGDGFAAKAAPASGPHGSAPSEAKAIGSLYPCQLTDSTDQALAELARDLVKAWGDRALTVIELEDRIATAAEKAPTDDAQIADLRAAIAMVNSTRILLIAH